MLRNGNPSTGATHVEEDSVQMGAVALVQNSRGVPHVAVHEVYPEVRMDFLPTLEPLHWGILETGPLFKRTRGTYWGPLGGGEGITVDSESDAVTDCHAHREIGRAS